MISRRIIRIKIIQSIFAYFNSEKTSVKNAEKEFHHSIHRTYLLYYYIISLIIEIQKFASHKIELARQKNQPSYEDMHPNTRFINNRVIRQWLSDEAFMKFLESNKITWNNHSGFIKRMHQLMMESTHYQQYMEQEEDDLAADKRFLIKFLTNEILYNEEFYNTLEEISIYWNDEVDYIISLLSSDIRKIKSGGKADMLHPVYKDDQDKEFGETLLRKTILKFSEYRELIEGVIANWDIDRVAFMDMIITSTAISEILEFESIPVKVSFNEYLEISKYYSTDSSSTFINGILDKTIQKLREDNRIVKRGRGLIGEV